MNMWVQTTRAVLGSLALAFATLGIAQAEDAGAQPTQQSMSAADQLPPDQEVSETAIELAGWVLASRDAHGYPFAIIDKETAQILVFGADGRLRGAAPGLFGSARGDHIAPGVAGLALSAIPGRDRTTPAGRFVGGYGPSIDAGPVLWVDYDSAVSIHPIAMVPRERRAERLASPTPNDNRITHGCINVSPEFYSTVVQPLFAEGGMFYVLPDKRALPDAFPTFKRRTASPSEGNAVAISFMGE
jgi:hypothetical protein